MALPHDWHFTLAKRSLSSKASMRSNSNRRHGNASPHTHSGGNTPSSSRCSMLSITSPSLLPSTLPTHSLPALPVEKPPTLRGRGVTRVHVPAGEVPSTPLNGAEVRMGFLQRVKVRLLLLILHQLLHALVNDAGGTG